MRTYREKRHFAKTPEPAGAGAKAGRADELGFVVQKHDASHLHYDFRLELDGVLLSWSVPKGPTLVTGERRLAVRTEDHPLEYASFEGVIPQGEYGGGTVIVWDRGTWTPLEDPRKGLAKGRLSFELHGHKLEGRFSLVRTKLDGGKRENWLLFKGRDEAARAAGAIVDERPESVVSGRTVEEVESSPDRVWHSNHAEPAQEAQARSRARATSRPPRATAQKEDVVELVKKLPMGFALTNLEKVLYPEQGLRKAELIAYFVSVAEWMLPHVDNRPLALVRCPDGRHKDCFFQKHAKNDVPDVVARLDIREGTGGGGSKYMAVHDMKGVVALAQLGVLEIHAWPCHADKIERPDQLIFDLDPDEVVPWSAVVDAAFEMKQRLARVGLESFVKTTGGKGLHVVAPVTRRLDWDEHRAFAHDMARAMARAHPDRYLINQRKALRKGKIFLDYMRNGRGATAITPYSPRARHGATVATPITWSELAQGISPAQLDVRAVVARLRRIEADPWEGYAQLRQSISAGARRDVASAP